LRSFLTFYNLKSAIMKFLKFTLLAITFSFIFLSVNSQKKQSDKIRYSTEVLREFSKLKEKIPEELFSITEGIIIIPNMINVGLGVAGKRGKGIAIVKNANGSWSNPAFVTLTGGSAGLQAGVQSVDLILLFKQRETLSNIGKGSFTLGGDISITAGPLGRNSTASTDYKLEAEVYSYSKSKGLFAGISLSGSSLSIDEDAAKNFYGRDVSSATIFHESRKSNLNETKQIKQVLTSLFR
ncbi:MAG TPA: lipid-binding SYLF domain-containing protein, partial [Segetibacter sp.]